MKLCFKLLTFFSLLIANTTAVFSQSIEQNGQASFLRWKINSAKSQIKVSKDRNKVTIQSLDPDFFESFAGNITKLKRDARYHKTFKFNKPDTPGAPYKLDITLNDSSIELFSFYKNDEKAYMLDFWVNQDVVATKKASLAATPKLAKLENAPSKKKVVKKMPSAKVSKVFAPANNKINYIDPNATSKKKDTKKFRDFRYGASFIWNYDALIPPLKDDISLKEKAPDYLYEIKDRELLDDKKESHMQLSINFYRKEQWGLMTKSIKLYDEKYGRDKYRDLNDFMKAVSMIKNAIKTKVKPKYTSKIDENGDIVAGKEFSQAGIFAAARNILTNVVESTQNYELAKATLRYLIQYSRNEDDYIQALNLAKSLYVKASEDFDDEMIIFSSRVILNSLAHLKQLDKIKQFLENKAVIRVLPGQEGEAYISFINLFNDNTKQVISNFISNQKSYGRSIHPAILFNTAEAFFREGSYKKSVKLFDEFLAQYSSMPSSSEVRSRIAVAYDLLDEDPKKVLRLYKDAINKSPNLKVRYESKIRYVGLRVARKKKLDERDIETIVFLEGSDAEKRNIGPNLKKLLWLTRLRTFISQGKYEDALAYLASLPIENLRRVEQRTFNADGAEIVLGVIQNSYSKGNYAKAVKFWEIYKDKYSDKVAQNPYLNFVVSDSFIKLGLLKSYKRAVSELKTLNPKMKRRYPLWVDPLKNISIEDYVTELNLSALLKEHKYKELEQFLERNKKNKNINYKFYKGLVSYKLKNYTDSVTSFESLLVTPNINNVLTTTQNNQMLEAYLESLYESVEGKRFRRNVSALTNDMRRSTSKEHKTLLERAEYLYIESLFSESQVNTKLLETKSKEFLAENKKSSVLKRVQFLNAYAAIRNGNEEDGKKSLNELLEDKETPEYLKGLVRSELTTLELMNKTI